MDKPTQRRGFTLIELLVVVAIIALLIAILLPSLGAAKRVAQRSTCAANLHGIGNAYSIYASTWENVIPYAMRGYGNGTTRSGAGIVNDSIQQIGLWSYQNLGQWLAPDSFREVQPNFATLKLWVCPAVGGKNPFLLPVVYPGVTPAADTFWDQYHTVEYNGSQPKWLQPGSYKAAVFMGYQFYAGDTGNVSTTGVAQVVYTSNGQPYAKFDNGHNGRDKLATFKPNELLAQDLAMQEPGTSGFFDANHMNTGTFLRDSYGIPGSSGFQGYVQAFAVADSETAIAGCNALYADWSVSFVTKGKLDKVTYTSPVSGTVTKLFVANR